MPKHIQQQMQTIFSAAAGAIPSTSEPSAASATSWMVQTYTKTEATPAIAIIMTVMRTTAEDVKGRAGTTTTTVARIARRTGSAAAASLEEEKETLDQTLRGRWATSEPAVGPWVKVQDSLSHMQLGHTRILLTLICPLLYRHHLHLTETNPPLRSMIYQRDRESPDLSK